MNYIEIDRLLSSLEAKVDVLDKDVDRLIAAKAALEAERDQLREALREARLQLEYLDTRFPTGTTPPIVARIDAALEMPNAACDCVPGNTDDCPIHGVAHSSHECAVAEDATPSLDA